ncbi:LysR family transcriptional regulator [Tropicimonas sediminicola]|uniref:DNA-binding transcriptional regulator, LysR family n=1 Tax=Tropicimonas sediminicola TaxID=1031541 RepID=A0A239LLX3_9RHOB|nr:LysR family transcriptional regulator [Tropicimonas sediminicola]SNT30669.1 DNA-binding transcriptional regulator, LysR family [Tropicimonas sediminicola]
MWTRRYCWTVLVPNSTIDLRLLNYFLRTAELRNISKAAEALNVAQPTLSKAIQQLEHQLQARVFLRTAHGVEVTPIGERLLRHAKLVSAQVSDAVEEVEAMRDGSAGQVRVGAGPSWVRRKLPEAVAVALAERPGLQVSVSGGFDERLLQGLEDGALDFVVAEKPLSGGGQIYDYDPLTDDALIVIGRPQHPLAGRKGIPPEEALAADWALPPQHTLARRKLDGRVISLGEAPPTPLITSNSQTFLLTFAHFHDVLLYTTRSVLQIPEACELVEVDVPELASSRAAGLIYRRPKLLTPAAAFVAETLKAVCAAEPVN